MLKSREASYGRTVRAVFISCVCVIVVSGQGVAQTYSGKPHAHVSVDCNVSLGPFFQSERYNNFTSADKWAAERPADIRFYNDQGLHGKIYRVWIFENDLYNPKTDTYDYSSVTSYLNDASKISDAILINYSDLIGPVQGSESASDQHRNKVIISSILEHLKHAYPKITYVEVFNEPDYGWAKKIKPGDLYSYYVPFYEAVNEVNKKLGSSAPLQVGGPAFFEFDVPWLKAFLDDYKNDSSSGKRLDFISYHAYGYFYGPSLRDFFLFNRNPSAVKGQRKQLNVLLQSRSLNTRIPSFITELGPYPGPSFDAKKGYGDMLRQATGTASLLYWFMDSPQNIPFNWVLRHQTEGRKDQLVTRVPNDKGIVPTDKFTPYGNMMVMMSKMKKTRVVANSGPISVGKGVYALAAKDSSGVSVLLWNYQHVDQDSFTTEVRVPSLPSIFRHKEIEEMIYRIGEKTSNYFADHAHGNLRMVSDRIIAQSNDRYTRTVELEPNSLDLIVLEPVSDRVILKSTFNDEVTGAYPSWTVTEPAGTDVSIVNEPDVRNRSAYLSANSTPAAISSRFSSQTSTISAEWRFKESSDGAKDRFELLNGTNVAVDVSVNGAGELVTGHHSIKKLAPNTWHTLRVDADASLKRYSVWLDGNLRAKQLGFSEPVASLNGVSVRSTGTPKSALYIDYVRITTGRGASR